MAEKIICVVGPTACGKTKLGVLLAKRYDGEVVSAEDQGVRLERRCEFGQGLVVACLTVQVGCEQQQHPKSRKCAGMRWRRRFCTLKSDRVIQIVAG